MQNKAKAKTKQENKLRLKEPAFKNTAMQACAIKNYTDPNSETFNNLLKSMVMAGYSAKYAHRNGWHLLAKPEVKAIILAKSAEIEAKRTIEAEYNRAEAHDLLKDQLTKCDTEKKRSSALAAIKELDNIYGLQHLPESRATLNQLIVSDPAERKRLLEQELKLLNAIESAPLAIAEE